MSDSIQTQGKTVNDAVSEALLQLGLRRDEVEIKVLEEPKSGLFGFIGGRQARVMVRKKPSRGRGRGRGRDYRDDDQAHSLGKGSGKGRRGGGGGRGRGRNEDEQRQEARGRGGRDAKPADDREEGAEKSEGRRRRRRGSRGGRGRGRGQGQEQRQDQRQDAQASREPREDKRQDRGEEKREDTRRAAPENERRGGDDDQPRRSRSRRGGRGRGRGRDRDRDQQQDAQNVQAEPNGNVRDDRNDRNDRDDRDQGREEAPVKRSRSRRERPAAVAEEARPVPQQEKPVQERVPEAAPEAPVEEIREPAATPATEAAPVTETPREEPTPAAATEETPVAKSEEPTETPEAIAETPAEEKPAGVAKPKPKRSGWGGGLGARLAKKNNPAVKNRKPVEVLPDAPEPTRAPRSSGGSRGDSYGSSRGGGSYGGSRGGGSYGGADEVIVGGVPATKYANSLGEVNEDGMNDALADLAKGLLVRAGFPCDVEVNDGEYRQVRITSDDEDDAGMLIGRHGQTVDAVEHLVERMASNAIDDRVRMNLDINEYRVRRTEALVDRAREAAADVLESGRPWSAEPMDARERRIIHLEIEQMDGVTTTTEFGSSGKYVVIRPENEGGQTDD